MSNIVKFNDVRDKIVTIRGKRAIVDSVVAELYGRDVKEINQAVRNNPKKFPEGYILEMTDEEYKSLRSKILTLEKPGRGQHKKYLPKAFTKKGCYMLATVLTGDKAIETTIDIIESFDKLTELQEIVAELPEATDEKQQKSLVQRGGEIISDLIGNNQKTSEEETSFEINLAMVKFKRTVKIKN